MHVKNHCSFVLLFLKWCCSFQAKCCFCSMFFDWITLFIVNASLGEITLFLVVCWKDLLSFICILTILKRTVN